MLATAGDSTSDADVTRALDTTVERPGGPGILVTLRRVLPLLVLQRLG
jgi:hypothetical protein